ncbi:hypothetical protein BDY24DRAFT_52950 [Mrakia frigida]|uniref:uncharacterized protein n=1 Tax=Mrakia frigida TaxID=29902 RepID=UPI003FCC1086
MPTFIVSTLSPRDREDVRADPPPFSFFLSLQSVGECWDWANVTDENGNVQITYFRCAEASTAVTPTYYTTTAEFTATAATFTGATTYLPPSNITSATAKYQTPAASSTIEIVPFPSNLTSTSTSTEYYSSTETAAIYVSSSSYNNSTNSDPSKSSNNNNENNKPSPLPIILAVVFGTLFALLLVALLIFYLRRRRRARRREAEMTPFYPPGGEGILSDRRISSAFTRFPSRASGITTSYTPEPTFIQPVVGLGLGAGVGGRILTSREKRLTMRRSRGGAVGGEEEMGGGGWEENGDEVLRRKMEGWNAVAERTGTGRIPEGAGAAVGEKDPFSDSYSVLSNPSRSSSPSLSLFLLLLTASLLSPSLDHTDPTTLPTLPPPLRLPLTITTSLAPPRSAARSHLNPLSPSPSLNSPNTLSPQFDPSYSPATGSTESQAPLLDGNGQAEDGGVSLMGGMHGGGREGQQAPPAYIWR